MAEFKGSIIAEGLDDPTIVNGFKIYRAHITKEGIPIDYEGRLGRWHIYDVACSRKEISDLQPHILKGWYAHFWKGDNIIVAYNDKQFEISKKDRSAWKEAIEHGISQEIPEDELDSAMD
ncbi:MAG: hypothetical protein ACUVT7_01200 [Thermoplasmata archaeon]